MNTSSTIAAINDQIKFLNLTNTSSTLERKPKNKFYNCNQLETKFYF